MKVVDFEAVRKARRAPQVLFQHGAETAASGSQWPFMDSNLIDNLGCLDKIELEGGTLTFTGWVASYDAGPVEGFRLTIGGKTFGDFPARRLASPDVLAARPLLDFADCCRFDLRVPLNAKEQEEARSAVIMLTPLFGKREGTAMVRILEPSLPLPPKYHMNAIGSDGAMAFLADAFEFQGHYLQRAKLRPTDDMLDIGCGVGRKAFTLTQYLAPTARYEGFDTVDWLIQWAQETITPRHPNFRFQHVSLYSKFYNPEGAVKTVDFVFPYEDHSFDFILLASVFTHLGSKETCHYLDEMHRVLRPGGRTLFTAFMLNDESEKLIASGRSAQNLIHPLDEYYTTDPERPEAAIGFKETLLMKWIEERGFAVRGKYYGGWCRRPRFTSYQDILVLQKK